MNTATTGKTTRRSEGMTMRDLIGDIIGAICLFLMLFGLLFMSAAF